MLWFIIAAVIIAIDQLSKYLAFTSLNGQPNKILIEGFLYLTYTENKGAAFSMLQNARIFFLILTTILAAGIIYYIVKNKSNMHRMLYISLSVVLGGALGNFVDRARTGEVIDFIGMDFGSYHFPIFNIADSAIVVGTILLAIYVLFIHKEKENTPEEPAKEMTDTAEKSGTVDTIDVKDSADTVDAPEEKPTGDES